MANSTKKTRKGNGQKRWRVIHAGDVQKSLRVWLASNAFPETPPDAPPDPHAMADALAEHVAALQSRLDGIKQDCATFETTAGLFDADLRRKYLDAITTIGTAAGALADVGKMLGSEGGQQ